MLLRRPTTRWKQTLSRRILLLRGTLTHGTYRKLRNIRLAMNVLEQENRFEWTSGEILGAYNEIVNPSRWHVLSIREMGALLKAHQVELGIRANGHWRGKDHGEYPKHTLAVWTRRT